MVRVVPNRDSAILALPGVDGVKDYRAFAIPAGVSVETKEEGGEGISGTTIYCAGYRQHNDAFTGDRELLSEVEVAGLKGPTRLVVEALDRPCPFTGVRGKDHADLRLNGTTTQEGLAPPVIYTEEEIEKSYGSVVENGHGGAEVLGTPAPPSTPRVLARTTVLVTPLGYGTARVGSFFDDFASDDQPAFVRDLDDFARSQRGKLFQNQRWSFFSYGAENAQFFVDRGQLRTVVADWMQDIFASNFAMPRRPAALSDTDYLHVTFEVGSSGTARRYWWLFLCGAETLGETMDPETGLPRSNFIQTPFFYANDGRNLSVEGWNCLQVLPLDGAPFQMAPDGTRPETDLRVVVNKAGDLGRSSVRSVGPLQLNADWTSFAGWLRQQDASGALVAPMLDDRLLQSQRTRFDLYVRRDRVILYADGAQRLCNDFPNVPLTMAEAAVGFGHVLYHSAAERHELAWTSNNRTGQRYYLENTPFIDARSWDNLGYSEHVVAPQGFREDLCYVHTGP
jgi:hypothetical protein